MMATVSKFDRRRYFLKNMRKLNIKSLSFYITHFVIEHSESFILGLPFSALLNRSSGENLCSFFLPEEFTALPKLPLNNSFQLKEESLIPSYKSPPRKFKRIFGTWMWTNSSTSHFSLLSPILSLLTTYHPSLFNWKGKKTPSRTF